MAPSPLEAVSSPRSPEQSPGCRGFSLYPHLMPAKAKPVTPNALRPGGRALWDEVLTREPQMTEPRKRVLLEACRLADRLDEIDAGLGDDYAVLQIIEEVDKATGDITSYVVSVKQAVATAKGLGEQMSKHLATLRVLTPADVKPEKRGNPGGARGSYKTDGPAPTALELVMGEGG